MSEVGPIANAGAGALTVGVVLARLVGDVLFVYGLIPLAVWCTLLVSAPLTFVVWLYSLHRQTDGFESFEREASHTALWCWFVPGFNGAQPARLMWDLWRSLGLAYSPRFVYVIATWWALVLVRWPLMALAVRCVFPWLAVVAHVLSGLLTCWVVVQMSGWMVQRQRCDAVRARPTAF